MLALQEHSGSFGRAVWPGATWGSNSVCSYVFVDGKVKQTKLVIYGVDRDPMISGRFLTMYDNLT